MRRKNNFFSLTHVFGVFPWRKDMIIASLLRCNLPVRVANERDVLFFRRIFFFQLTQDHFRGGKILFSVVTFFAAGDEVAAITATAARDRDEMVHGQFIGREFFSAVMANSPGQLVFPPGRLSNFPCLFPFAPDMGVVFLNIDPIFHVIIPQALLK